MLILIHSERSIKATVIMITTIIISFSKARLPAVLNKQSQATRSEGLSFHLVLTELVSQHPLIYASSGERAFPTAISDPVSLCKVTHHRASYFYLQNGANHLQALTPAIVSVPHLSGSLAGEASIIGLQEVGRSLGCWLEPERWKPFCLINCLESTICQLAQEDKRIVVLRARLCT